MIRHLAVAALATAGLAVGTPSAQAVCPPYLGVSQPAAGVQACVSLVNDCVDANVYYRVLTTSGNTSSLYQPVCIP